MLQSPYIVRLDPPLIIIPLRWITVPSGKDRCCWKRLGKPFAVDEGILFRSSFVCFVVADDDVVVPNVKQHSRGKVSILFIVASL